VATPLASQALLAAYDDQLRTYVDDPLPAGIAVERDGPLLRTTGYPGGSGAISYKDLGGLEGREVDTLISRQVAFFRSRGEWFEWKLHGHDKPADLGARLQAAGFEPEDQETVVIAPVETIAQEPQLPAGVTLRQVTERADFARIAAMEHAIWGDDRNWLADSLAGEHQADPDAITVFVAESGSDVVCAAWIRFPKRTEFATLWGGGTLPAFRARGIYRGIVAARAQLARARGCRFLQVDASDDSRPILERLGFVAVTTTTPYVWSPPEG
jgi:GNAT superfamily N-acetyltransferase